MRVDACQHFWEYNDSDYAWMGPEHEAIRRAVLPDGLAPLLDAIGSDWPVCTLAERAAILGGTSAAMYRLGVDPAPFADLRHFARSDQDRRDCSVPHERSRDGCSAVISASLSSTEPHGVADPGRALLAGRAGDAYLLNMNKTIMFLSAVLILVLSATAVSADDHVIDVTGDTAEIKEIEVGSRGLRFTVTEIRVNLGDTIRLTYVNGGGRHDWALAEYAIWTEVITGGQSDTIEFVADKAGDFEFYCGVPGHRRAGMVGRFIVVDPSDS